MSICTHSFLEPAATGSPISDRTQLSSWPVSNRIFTLLTYTWTAFLVACTKQNIYTIFFVARIKQNIYTVFVLACTAFFVAHIKQNIYTALWPGPNGYSHSFLHGLYQAEYPHSLHCSMYQTKYSHCLLCRLFQMNIYTAFFLACTQQDIFSTFFVACPKWNMYIIAFFVACPKWNMYIIAFFVACTKWNTHAAFFAACTKQNISTVQGWYRKILLEFTNFFTKPGMMPAIWRRKATQRYATLPHIQ